MWRYPTETLPTAFVEEAKRKLLCSWGKQENFYAYGELDDTLLLPRFYFCPALPLPHPYAQISVDVTLIRMQSEFSGNLYSKPPQEQASQIALQTLRQDLPPSSISFSFGGTLSLRSGFGRIVTSLFVASSLQTRTIIITHNQEKQKKWEMSIQCFFPHVKDLVQTSVLNDDILVLTQEQILKMCENSTNNQLKSYGFVILDDVNQLKLSFFAKFLNLWNIKRLLGLTNHKTYWHPLIEWSVGPIIFDSENVWSSPESCSSSEQGPVTRTVGDPMEMEEKENEHTHRIGKMFHIYKHSEDDKTLEQIRNDLYMRPKLYDACSGKLETDFYAYTENANHINVPRFYGTEKYGIPENVDVSIGVPMSKSVKFEGTLKEENPPQKRGHDIVIETMASSRTTGTILNYYCGAGKTVIALAIAVSNGVRTLILVHTVDLLEQWIKRIARFVPKASIGRIQQKICDVKDRDFVVGMIQSLASRNYPGEDMDTFGLCIVDECHRIACRFFSSALTKIAAAHILGLSATAYRKDGMNSLLFWSCGPIRFSVPRPFVRVNVRMIECKPNIRERFLRGGIKHNRSRMLNDLADDENRNELILREITGCFLKGRTTILLTERLKTIRWLKVKLGEDMLFQDNYGIHTGEVNQKERDEALTKKIILATYQKAREGLDVHELDTLLLASPVSDVIQATGRILRDMPEKETPLIVDIWDAMDPFLGSGHARRRYYKKKGFYIEDVQNPSLYEVENSAMASKCS